MGASMEEKVNYAVVGIFVLVLSLGLIGGVLWFSSSKSYLMSYDVYQTYMTESVAGLNVNAPVRYRGVQVGRVRTIALAPNNVEQVLLTLDIVHGTPVKVDTVAVLRMQGLTGLAFLELSAGGRDSPALKVVDGEKYPVIKAGPSLTMRLESTVMALLVNLNRSSEKMNTLLDQDNQRMFKQTLADIEKLSHTLAARSASIDASLGNAALTMENTVRFSRELPQIAQRVQHSADAFDHTLATINATGVNANRTLDDTHQFTSETLPDIQQMVSELRDLSLSLRRVSSELEKDPSVLLYGKTPLPRGPGE